MRWNVASIVIVIIAVLLQLYGHWGGLLTTGDSCHYIGAAKSFKESFSLGTEYRYFPPLFPIILSVVDPYWLHVILVVVVSILIIEQTKLIDDNLIRLVCQASIIPGVHVLMIGVFLWSELLFLLLLFLFTKALEKNFIVAIIVGFFLCLQRNAGVFFVIGAAIWYWDLRKSIALFLISSSGCIAWNIYASIAGEHAYFQSIWHNTTVVSTEIMHLLAPVPGILLLIVVGLLIYFLKEDQKCRLIIIMCLCYLAGLVSIFQFESYDADRYIAVIVPFVLIIIFRAFEIAVEKQTSAVRKLLIILAICWLVYPFSRTLKNAVQWHNLSFTSYFCAIQF